MKAFLKPSLWKIFLCIFFLFLSYFFWMFYISFFGENIGCPLTLPQSDFPNSPVGVPNIASSYVPKIYPTPEPYTFIGTIREIPNVISDNYDTCTYRFSDDSGSIVAAKNIVIFSPLFISFILSYPLSCLFIAPITKRKNKNTKKK
jgi:hypothetical protein